MTGIAALAAAAAATQKIQGTTTTTTTVPGTPLGGLKVVTPTIVTHPGVKVTPVQGKIQGRLAGVEMLFVA